MSPDSFIGGFVTAIVIFLGVRLYMLKEKEIKNFVYRVKDRIFK